jgi:hypothetical protein
MPYPPQPSSYMKMAVTMAAEIQPALDDGAARGHGQQRHLEVAAMVAEILLARAQWYGPCWAPRAHDDAAGRRKLGRV